MDDFGKSLHIDDPSYIPAAHFQNNRVPRDQACYMCHTNYTMLGTVTAKINGLRNLWVQYVGTIPSIGSTGIEAKPELVDHLCGVEHSEESADGRPRRQPEVPSAVFL